MRNEGLVSERPAILGGPPVRPAGPPAWPRPTAELYDAWERAYREGAWGRYDGPFSRELVEQMRGALGCTHVELCASGTAAVELALEALYLAKRIDKQTGEGETIYG